MTTYAVVDVETTGGSPVRDKITDVAIYIYDGDKITDAFESLVNPERNIPSYITDLTGITNRMVEDAPCYYEIAKKIIKITENCIFVGHNVNFDYNFIKNEFRQLGYEYKRDTICTVKLAQKLMPEMPGYKLDILTSALNIKIENRHRAAGDARATVDLFAYLKRKDNLEYQGKHVVDRGFTGLHSALDISKVKSLPEGAGVYYFYDENGVLLYVGKSKNIYKRVHTHLNNEKNPTAVEMKSRIAEVDYEETGSELVALLKESNEIKEKNPHYNKAQRSSMSKYGLYSFEDYNGYIQLEIRKNQETKDTPVLCFGNKKSARASLFNWVKDYELCEKLCGLYESAGACFSYGLKECKGACIGEESFEDYNFRVHKLLRKCSIVESNMLLIESGRDSEELAVVQVEHGKYIGYGYIHRALADSMDDMLDCIKRFPDDRNTSMIIRLYIEKNSKRLHVVEY
jgi:DNA polymerase-3 subunit epsilon